MFTETLEPFRYAPATALNDLCYDSSCIIEPYLCGHTAYMFKYRNQSFQQAFHVFSIIKLEKNAVTVWETEYKIFCFVMEFPVLVKVGCTEVGLCFTRSVFKGNVTSCFVKIQFFFPLFDIKSDQSVATGEIFIFAFQALVDPFCSVALFSWGKLIRFQPTVNL